MNKKSRVKTYNLQMSIEATIISLKNIKVEIDLLAQEEKGKYLNGTVGLRSTSRFKKIKSSYKSLEDLSNEVNDVIEELEMVQQHKIFTL